MCYFVVVGIPKNSVVDALDTLPTGLQAEPHSNYGGLANHMPDCSIYLITEGACACSLFRPFVPLSKSRRKRLTEEFQRQGLTPEQIETHLDKMNTPNESHFGFRSDIRSWISDIVDKEGKAFVYIHWAANKIPKSPRRVVISPERLRENSSLIREDELCLVEK